MTSHHPFTLNNLDLLREMEMEATACDSDCQSGDMDFDAFSIRATSNAQLQNHDKSAYLKTEAFKYGEDNDPHTTKTGEEIGAHKPPANLGHKYPPRIHLPEDIDNELRGYDENKEEGLLQKQESFVSCKSPFRRQNLELPPLVSGRTSAGSRRGSTGSSRRHSAQRTEDGSWNESQEYALKDDSSYRQEMSLTERRIAMVRNQFSSRNLFNVQRQTSTSAFNTKRYSSKADNSLDASRKSVSDRVFSQQRSFPGGQGRPVTSFSGFQGRQLHSNGVDRLSVRPTTTSGPKGSRFGNQHVSAVDSLVSRKPRSRRQLEKLSQRRIDPFGAEVQAEESCDCWMPLGDVHQDLLQRLRGRGSLLQQRVSGFLKDLDDFNRRDHKTGLEHILEIT